MTWATAGAPPTPPSYFPVTTQLQRAGLYFNGQSMGVTLSQSGATSYVVVDGITGVQVASGTISGTSVTIGTAGTAPFDRYGSWRVEMTGPNTDANYGSSYGTFWVYYLPTDARFPTNPAVATGNVPIGEFVQSDPYTRGVLGIGPNRMSIHFANDPTNGTAGAATIAITQGYVAQEKAYYTQFDPDSVRPRASFLSFPNGVYDRVQLGPSNAAGDVFALPGVNGANVWIQVDPGTSSGVKLTVRSPDSATIVETYDNQANGGALAAAIAASSAYIADFCHSNSTVPSTMAATNIGNAYATGVTEVVAACYPDITYYEGPINEPTVATGAELAFALAAFKVAVKAGASGAKVLGPQMVAFDTNLSAYLAPMFAAGASASLDAPSSHGYNDTDLGDIPSMRQLIGAWSSLMVANGFTSWWQTENVVFTDTYGVLHPRRGVNWQMLMVFMLERYGCPKEQTNYWYDTSHGFWAEPGFYLTTSHDLFPSAFAYRALSAEVYGKAYTSSVTFGAPYDDYMVGNIYADPSTGNKTYAFLAEVGTSIPIAFRVVGSSTLTAVDWAGNQSTIAVVGGSATLTVKDLPKYLRVPSGTTISAITPTPAGGGLGPNLAPAATVTSTGSSTNLSHVNDGINTNGYATTVAPYIDTTGSLPGSVTLTWGTGQTLNHVIVRCPPPWQSNSSLLDFDIQTSTDGSTFTTQATTTKTPNVYEHASAVEGTIVSSWWDEQHVFDFTFPSALTGIKAVRIYVRATSYGGEPTIDAVTQGGQGHSAQQIALTDVWVSNDAPAVVAAPSYLFRHGAFV